MTSKPKSTQQQLNEFRARLDHAEAIAEVQAAEITTLKISNAQLRKKAKLDVPPVTAGSDWRTPKQAAFELGKTVAGISYLVDAGTLRRRPGPGPVLIDAQTIKNYKML